MVTQPEYSREFYNDARCVDPSTPTYTPVIQWFLPSNLMPNYHEGEMSYAKYLFMR